MAFSGLQVRDAAAALEAELTILGDSAVGKAARLR
jgi:hypothetical protein